MLRCVERLSQAELRAKLRALSSEYATLAFIGSGQGTGKTTALQAFLDAHVGEPVGVTSVGVDGAALNGASERSRAVLSVPRGAILATTTGCLAHGDVTREILADTGVHTPLGEVLIVKAHSGGWIELAGPSVVTDLAHVCRLLKSHGARRVFVDGSQGRLSLVSQEGGGAAVFTVRPEPTKSLDACVGDACRILEQLTLPAADAPITKQFQGCDIGGNAGKLLVIDANVKKTHTYTSIDIIKDLSGSVAESTLAVGIRGALTNETVDRLLGGKPTGRDAGWAGLQLVVEDGTRLFLDERRRERLRVAGLDLRVARPFTVIGVAVNPGVGVAGAVSPPTLMETLAAAVRLPLVDVIGGWYVAGI